MPRSSFRDLANTGDGGAVPQAISYTVKTDDDDAGLLSLFVTIFAGGLFLFFAGFAAWSYLVPAERGRTVASVAEQPAQAPAAPLDEREFETDRSACWASYEAAKKKDRDFDLATTAAFDLTGNDSEKSYIVSCLGVHAQKMCNADYRKRYGLLVNWYYGSSLAQLRMVKTGAIRAMTDRDIGGQVQGQLDSLTAAVKADWQRSPATAAFRKLLASGHLQRNDFGSFWWGEPSWMESVAGNTPNPRRPC